jgi:hypothetical protein
MQYGINLSQSVNTTIKHDTIWCDSLSPYHPVGINLTNSRITLIDANWIYHLGSRSATVNPPVYGICAIAQPGNDSALTITNNMIDLDLSGTFSVTGISVENCNMNWSPFSGQLVN